MIVLVLDLAFFGQDRIGRYLETILFFGRFFAHFQTLQARRGLAPANGGRILTKCKFYLRLG